MTLANKAATCSNCGKRLNRKSWYYRNNAYFCKRRCWETAQSKAAATPEAKPAAADTKPESAKERA
jgi:hypothetical protein